MGESDYMWPDGRPEPYADYDESSGPSQDESDDEDDELNRLLFLVYLTMR